MRQVGLSDLDAAARAVLARPRPEWEEVARDLIESAHTADIRRKRSRAPDPSGATGSLYTQASLRKMVPSSRANEQYCAALAIVLAALATWRGRLGDRTHQGMCAQDPQV